MPARSFNYPALRRLSRQLLIGPQDVRLRQLERAEALLHNVHRGERYSFEHVYEGITTYRDGEGPARLMEGQKLYADIMHLCDALSESLKLQAQDVPERVYTMEDLVEMFNVSLRTISRWSRMGLVQRKLLFPDGRRRIAFLQKHVDAFLPRLGRRSDKADLLRPIADEERVRMEERANELVFDPSLGFGDIVRRVAGEFERSPQTVRYVLVRHCASCEGPLRERLSAGQLDKREKEEIYQLIESGKGFDEVAGRYTCGRAAVQRAYYQVAARHILDEPIAYVSNEMFENPKADKIILDAAMPHGKKPKARKAPPAGTEYFVAMTADPQGQEPLLTREQEQDLFRRYNYLKYKVCELRKGLVPSRAKAGLVRRIGDLWGQAIAIKQRLIRANLGLVISIARRHLGPRNDLGKLISDGNYSLMLAIEKFDFGRGFRFSTYASWAIMKNYAKSIPEESYQLENFVTGTQELMEGTGEARNLGMTREERLPHLREELRRFVNKLSDRERRILVNRFGLFDATPPRTLEQVGNIFDLSKERIRQIEERALAKLRKIMEREKLEALLEE